MVDRHSGQSTRASESTTPRWVHASLCVCRWRPRIVNARTCGFRGRVRDGGSLEDGLSAWPAPRYLVQCEWEFSLKIPHVINDESLTSARPPSRSQAALNSFGVG